LKITTVGEAVAYIEVVGWRGWEKETALLDHSGSGWATFLVSAYLLRALGGAAPTCAQTPQINALEVCGRKDQSAHNRAAREELERWLSAVEGAAADIEEVGDKLFSHGAPSDPNLLSGYHFTKRAKAALALSAGTVRVGALHSMLTDGGRMRFEWREGPMLQKRK
jgi:hypothetical protein